MFTMDNGSMIKLKELESTAISMELNMKETGKGPGDPQAPDGPLRPLSEQS
jgi:hypothetical protein